MKLDNSGQAVAFTGEEVDTHVQPHNDMLVVVVGIDHVLTHQMLVDGGSSTNILPLAILGWDIRCGSLLVSFTGERVFPEGNMKLPRTLGEWKDVVTRVEEFMVVDDPLAYNAIFGRMTIHHLRVVPSTYHQTMKFPTPNRMGIVNEQQRALRSGTPLP